MTIPVPMPVARLTDGAAPVKGSAGVGTVRSLWMLTTAPRTFLAASTAGVTRGLLLLSAGVPAKSGVMVPRPTTRAAAVRRRETKRCERMGVPNFLVVQGPGAVAEKAVLAGGSSVRLRPGVIFGRSANLAGRR